MKSILIVGAGPAGMAAAIRAKQLNFSVTVIDIADENYEKTCGDGLTERAVSALKYIGISPEELVSAGANVIHSSLRLYPHGRHVMPHEDLSYFTLRRINLMHVLRYQAVSMGATIHYRTAYHPDIAEGADFIIDASGCQWKQLASGMHYPMGMSSVIKATSNLHTDTLYFVYPEDGHSRYGWAFPLSNGMWNIGVWDPDNPKNLQVLFDGFKERFLDRYLSDIVVVQPLRGAPLGTICPHTAIIPGAISCGDAAGLCDPHSGEGVSYALQSGIELAESIPT